MLQQEVEKENKDLVFKPAISESSRLIVNMRRGDQKVSERLINDANMTAEKKMQLAEAWQKKVICFVCFTSTVYNIYNHTYLQLYNNYKFEPQINEISEQIVMEKKEFQGENRGFLNRQRVYEEITEAKKEIMYANMEEAQSTEATFRPNIGNAEAVLVFSRPERLKESENDRLQRLSKIDVMRREAMR